jgi:hypothetical protein
LTGITLGVTLISTLLIYRTSTNSIKAALLDIAESKNILIEYLNNQKLPRDSILSILREGNSTMEKTVKLTTSRRFKLTT